MGLSDRPRLRRRTTVLEYNPADGRAEQIDGILDRYPETAYRIAALVQAAKVSRPLRVRRQSEGDRLDLEATITAAIDLRAGLTPSPNVYARLERRWRDLSVLVLIDASQSTNDIVKGAGRSALELERDATSLLAHAMDGMGDPFAIHAFCSDTREKMRGLDRDARQKQARELLTKVRLDHFADRRGVPLMAVITSPDSIPA
jgi:nitric oxide reductase NorD protein